VDVAEKTMEEAVPLNRVSLSPSMAASSCPSDDVATAQAKMR
jgi:hypothetical protein